MYEDWGLIEASVTTQYGIRLRNEPDMSWDEFSTLLSGIMPETPLGQIVSIRCENDKDVLKGYSKEQHEIRNAWRNKEVGIKALSDKDKADMVQSFQELMKNAFS